MEERKQWEEKAEKVKEQKEGEKEGGGRKPTSTKQENRGQLVALRNGVNVYLRYY